MKKTATALLCGSILCAACAFGACSAPVEERFEAATKAFDNYTAEVTMVVVLGTYHYDYDTVLEVDGQKAKAAMTRDSTTETVYLTEENGKVYSYANSRYGWNETGYRSIESVVADANYCYLEIFQAVFFGEVEEDGEYYRLKDNVLSTYSAAVGFTITNARVKLRGDRFTTAEVVGYNGGGGRFRIDYTFSKYGSTSVTLP